MQTRREFLCRLLPGRSDTLDTDQKLGISVSYDPELLEAVILLWIQTAERRGDEQPAQTYHALADGIYERTPPEQRARAFERLHRRLFSKWGLDVIIPQTLQTYPTLVEKIQSVMVARAWRPGEEGADIDRSLTRVGIRIRAERFLEHDGLKRFLHHEWLHMADLLDPDFGYKPEEHQKPWESTARERYRVLWAISVDGRLTQRGQLPLVPREGWSQDLRRLYPTLSSTTLQRVLEQLWTGPRPTHEQLWTMARDPRHLVAWVGEDAPQAGIRLLGAPCPLCQFPTHRWADSIPSEIVQKIQNDFPQWQPADGACERCLELYTILSTEPLGGTSWH